MATHTAIGRPFWNVWTYADATGVQREGAMVHVTDRGGTDITYWFHRMGEDGKPIAFPNGGIQLDLVSGSALKAARRIGNRQAEG